MTSLANSVPPYVFTQKGTFPAPVGITVPASLEIRPDTATAVFDGTGASGDFLACLTFIDPDGNRLCRMFNPTPVTAGDVAEVTYIPPFGAAASGSTTSGIQFDTNPQSGNWLDVQTVGADSSSNGVTFSNANPFAINQNITSASQIDALYVGAYNNGAGGTIGVYSNVDDAGGGDGYGFYTVVNGVGAVETGVNAGSVNFSGGTAVGANIGAETTGGGASTGANLSSQVTGGNGSSTGLHVGQVTTTTGEAIGILIDNVRSSAGGTVMPLIIKNAAGNPIFEVRGDGTIHGLASVGAITWDL